MFCPCKTYKNRSSALTTRTLSYLLKSTANSLEPSALDHSALLTCLIDPSTWSHFLTSIGRDVTISLYFTTLCSAVNAYHCPALHCAVPCVSREDPSRTQTLMLHGEADNMKHPIQFLYLPLYQATCSGINSYASWLMRKCDTTMQAPASPHPPRS